MTSAMKRQHQAISISFNSDFSTQDEQQITFSKPVVRACTECGARNTPQWRQGPQGPQTLCNACGVRYSRLHRKVKTPKKQLNDSPSSPKGSDGLEDEMEDSDGMTVFTQSPAAVHSPAVIHSSPAPGPTAATTTSLAHSFQTTSSVRPTRAVRTGLLAPQPCSPAATTTNTPNSSRRSSSGGATLAPFAKEPIAQQPAAAAKQSPDYDMDCEAANMLLSMAMGVPCMDRPAAQVEAPPAPAPVATRVSDAPAQIVTAQRQRSVESLPTGIERVEQRRAGPAPCLQPEEVRALQQLCGMFDERFKDLVAARAACDAVARVLRIKQDEARLAQAAARSAAQLLMVHAAQLSNHEAVQQALTLARAAERDVQALGSTQPTEALAGPSTAAQPCE